MSADFIYRYIFKIRSYYKRIINVTSVNHKFKLHFKKEIVKCNDKILVEKNQWALRTGNKLKIEGSR